MCLQSHKIGCADKTCFHRLNHMQLSFIISFQINEENLQFMQHRDVYCHDYFNFIRSLAFVNNVSNIPIVYYKIGLMVSTVYLFS